VRAIEAAEEINAAHPAASVHWRELISLPTPDGIQIALPAAGGRSQNSGRAPDKPADDGPPNSQAFGGRLGLRLNGVGQ
jgi:hypothetical protein